MDVSAGALAAGSGALKAAAGLAEGDAAATKEFVGELDDYLRKALGLPDGEQSTEEVLAVAQDSEVATQSALPLLDVSLAHSGDGDAADQALTVLGKVLADRPAGGELGSAAPDRSVSPSLGLVPDTSVQGAVGNPLKDVPGGGSPAAASEALVAQQLASAVSGLAVKGDKLAGSDADGGAAAANSAQLAERKWQSELHQVFRAPAADAALETKLGQQTLSQQAATSVEALSVQQTKAGGLTADVQAQGGAVAAVQAGAANVVAAAGAITDKSLKGSSPATPATEQVASVSDTPKSELDVSFFGAGKNKEVAGAKAAATVNAGNGASGGTLSANSLSAGTDLAATAKTGQASVASLASSGLADGGEVKIGSGEFSFASEVAGTVRGSDAQGATRTESLQTLNQTQSSQIAAQVAVEIARNLKNAQTRFQMRFDPPELGKVDVNMKVAADGSVQAHLIVERPETLDMFMRDQRALERALEAAGLNTDSDNLQFSLKKDDGQEFTSGDEQFGQGSEADRRAGSEDADGGESIPDDVVRMTLAEQRGGLDLKI
ncbi:MAG: flagellar hook-length control protein FliK [Roseibium sp.]